MDLHTFQNQVASIDFSQNHPNVVGDWEFEETETCFLAKCSSNAELLRGRGYQIIWWKPDSRFDDLECLHLVKMPSQGQGTVIDKYLL